MVSGRLSERVMRSILDQTPMGGGHNKRRMLIRAIILHFSHLRTHKHGAIRIMVQASQIKRNLCGEEKRIVLLDAFGIR